MPIVTLYRKKELPSNILRLVEDSRVQKHKTSYCATDLYFVLSNIMDYFQNLTYFSKCTFFEPIQYHAPILNISGTRTWQCNYITGLEVWYQD